jgi:hypothetical protein
MKRIFIAIGILGLITAGCNNDSATPAGKEDKATGGKGTAATTTETAVSLNELRVTKDTAKLLAQDWESKEDAQEAELSGGSTDLEMPYKGVSFFPDLTMVVDPRDHIRFGKWSLENDNKEVSLSFTDGAKMSLIIRELNAKTLVLADKATKKTIEFKADGKAQKQSIDDPFYGANNQWRIKPTKAETDEQVKKRVMDCVQFYYKLLTDKAARVNNSVATFVGLPEIFTFYDGMITVLGKDKLKSKWIDCFYNKEQAIKAQALLEDMISKKYKWDKKEPNWLKKDAAVLQQIYDNLAAAK